MTAGATGRSSSKYASVWYSALGFEVMSISSEYFDAQPGHHLLEMLSGLAIGLVEKKADVEHENLPY
jgi:hypothetical protein